MTQEEHLCLLLFAVTDIQMHQVKNGLRMLKKDEDEWGGENGLGGMSGGCC